MELLSGLLANPDQNLAELDENETIDFYLKGAFEDSQKEDPGPDSATYPPEDDEKVFYRRNHFISFP